VDGRCWLCLLVSLARAQRAKLIKGKPSAKAQREGFASSSMSEEIELASDAKQNQNDPDNFDGMDYF
jgi:hypothetical protein